MLIIMHKFMNVCKLMNIPEKVQNYLKNVFGQTYMKYDGCHGNVKSDRHNWHFKIFAGNERTVSKGKEILEG